MKKGITKAASTAPEYLVAVTPSAMRNRVFFGRGEVTRYQQHSLLRRD